MHVGRPSRAGVESVADRCHESPDCTRHTSRHERKVNLRHHSGESGGESDSCNRAYITMAHEPQLAAGA